MQQTRQCRMSKRRDSQIEMTLVNKKRFRILHQWYPSEIRKPADWVHKQCLASLGLFPYPDDCIPLAETIGAKVTSRITAVAAEHPNVKAPRELIRLIYNQLKTEYTMPNDTTSSQLRWMISHWVTTNLSDGRGGASAKNDIGDVVWEGALVQVDLSNGLFAGVVENQKTTESAAPMVGFPDIASMSTIPKDQIVAMTACLNTYINAVQAYGEKCEKDLKVLKEKAEVEARSLQLQVQSHREKADVDIQANESKLKMIETEIELHKIRQGDCATTMVEHPKKRKCTQDKLTTLLRSGRYSISASMLDHTNQVVDREPLSAEEVFPVVHQWFENRKDRVGICAVDVRTAPNASLLPEVFGWPSGHRHHFAGTRHEEQLRQHVDATLRPSVSASAIEVSDARTEQDSVGPTATLSCSFLRPPPSTSIRQAIGCEQQEQDIRRLCQVTSVSYEEWPAKPIHDEPPSADVIRRWNALPGHKKWKVHQLVQSMGWTSPVDSYLLVALGTKLDRWEWITGNNGYPKSAGHCLRRALLATRGLEGSPVMSRVRRALGCAP